MSASHFHASGLGRQVARHCRPPRDTDISEDVIRELALPLGFVDVKVCAVSEVWSGLKLVVRKALR